MFIHVNPIYQGIIYHYDNIMISNQLPIKMILQAWIIWSNPPVQHLRAIQQLEFNNFKGCFAGYLVFVT